MLRVPEDHDPDNHLTNFRKRFGKDFDDYYFHQNHSLDQDITDSNFSNPSHCLEPGRTYKVDFLKISGHSDGSFVAYMMEKTYKPLFVGMQGLAMLYQEVRPSLPLLWIVSLDQDDRLWRKSNGLIGIPCMNASPSGGTPKLSTRRSMRDRGSVSFFDNIVCFSDP